MAGKKNRASRSKANTKQPTGPYTSATPQYVTQSQIKNGPPASAESFDSDIAQRQAAAAASGRYYSGPQIIDRQTQAGPTIDTNSIADLNHQGTIIPTERIRRYRMMRLNPIRGLTPEVLVKRLEDWYLGYLRETAMMWDAIMRRDDILSTVIPKRKAAIGRKKWSIIIPEEFAEDSDAGEQKEALQYFYGNLRATHAVEQNQLGGVNTMAKQMIEAVGFKYVPHEILWRQTPQGVTAVLNQVPLWFFENRTGRLRFLPYDTSWDGDPLEDGAWMVTVGDGIMEACSVAWLYKTQPLKDWVIYSENNGSPGLAAITKSVPGSSQWQLLEQALNSVGPGFRTVINAEDKLQVLDWTGEGQLPMPILVERMDKALTALWRGGDLSTKSHGMAGQGQGASLQGDEADALEEDDCQMITDTCNMQLDPMVLRIVFGEDVEQKAYFRYGGEVKTDATAEMAVDTGLFNIGVPLSMSELRERYGRGEPDGGDDEVVKPDPQPVPEQGDEPDLADELSNEDDGKLTKLLKAAQPLMARSQSIVLRPLADRIKNILANQSDDALKESLASLRADLPSMLKAINRAPATAKQLEKILAAAMMGGLLSRVKA